MTAEWGCPKCKVQSSRVVDTDIDDDGYRVRVRKCIGCGTRWATEEIPIPYENFRLRVTEHRAAYERRARRRGSKRCRHCGYRYKRGYYSTHVKEARHITKLKRPEDATEKHRAQHRARTLRRYWRKKQA